MGKTQGSQGFKFTMTEAESYSRNERLYSSGGGEKNALLKNRRSPEPKL